MNNLAVVTRAPAFLEVVNQGSFTRAAQVLGQSKAAVSQQVSQLEAILGVRLLLRSTRRLSLTPAGQQFAERCRTLAQLTQLAIDELQEQGRAPSGKLTLSLPHAFEQVLPGILGEYLQRFPQLLPQLLVSDERLSLLEQGIDLAISVGDLPDSNERALPVGELQAWLCAAPAYLARRGMPENLVQLRDHRLLCAHWQQQARAWHLVDGQGERRQLEILESAYASSLQAVLAMAEQGLGVALLPLLVAQPSLQQGRLQRLLPEWMAQPRPIYVRHAYATNLPAHLRHFVTLLKAHLQGIARTAG
ncbi:LysR substrate-binding domain-containing protein [Pseudomonas sp. MBLB4123]|uniref:LysR family transcriptional regulator n=1 Tax=Pseudomonas sp. MBLB4123 TaxID=3451557 RepID=UPI003F74C544